MTLLPLQLFSQSTLIINTGTGDDDLRGGSQLNITVIFFNPERGAIVQNIAAGRRFPDRTTDRSEIVIPVGIDLEDIQEIRVEFVPDRRFGMEDDKWWFTRFVVSFQGASGTRTLFENNSVNKKFERQETWSTGIFSSFSNLRTKKITVVDSDNRVVYNAQVFLQLTATSPWIPLGNTNSSGQITTTQVLDNNSVLVARKMIHEQEYYRSAHDLNAAKNWNYRVYLTNIDIDRDGLATPRAQNITSREITLQILKTNTLIGCNLLVCSEWSLGATDIVFIKAELLAASKFLFNATDGQFFFEQLTIFDRGIHWNDSDYRIYNQFNYIANVPNVCGGFLGQNILGSAMKMGRDDIGSVYAHEFGHYGLDVSDEYNNDNGNIRCTPASGDASGVFAANGPKTSCMMWNQSQAKKLCSAHPLNPHVNGAHPWYNEGDPTCWEHIRARYNWSSNWNVISPIERGGIPGNIHMATGSLNDIPIVTPIFSVQTRFATSILGARQIRAETASGRSPLENVEISTISPTYSYHGTTNASGMTSVLGLADGSEMLAMHPSGVGATAVIDPGISPTAIRLNILTASGVARSLKKGPQSSKSVFADAILNVGSLNPQQSLLSVKINKNLVSKPEVRFLSEGVGTPIQLTASQPSNDSVKSYIIPNGNGYVEGTVIVKGQYEDGSLLYQAEHLLIAKGPATLFEELKSLSGILSIHWTSRKFPERTIAVISTREYYSKLPKASRLLGRQFKIITDESGFQDSTYASIRLPVSEKGLEKPKPTTKKLRVVYYNISKQVWQEQLQFKLNVALGMMTGLLQKAGTYALIEVD